MIKLIEMKYLIYISIALSFIVLPTFALAEKGDFIAVVNPPFTNPYIPTTPSPYFPTPSPIYNPPGSCSLPSSPKFQDLLSTASCIISGSVIPLIFALAVVMFIWGVVQYVINSDDETKKSQGRQFMIWGIIALTVMVSVWGLVKILGATFGIEYAIPQVKP